MTQTDVDEVQRRYAAMTPDQFASLKREELTLVGQQAYDREIARRSTEEFRAKEARKDEEFTRRVQTAPKRRGLVRLILGTFFIYGAVLQVALNAARSSLDYCFYAAFYGALGGILVWWGAHRRERWKRPLGITWIVFGILMVVPLPNIKRAFVERGLVFEGSAWILAGGVIMVVVGGILLFVQHKGPSAP